MDLLAAYLGYFMGSFVPTIGAFIIEFVVNKSNGGRWGYKITVIVAILNIAILVFGLWLKQSKGY